MTCSSASGTRSLLDNVVNRHLSPWTLTSQRPDAHRKAGSNVLHVTDKLECSTRVLAKRGHRRPGSAACRTCGIARRAFFADHNATARNATQTGRRGREVKTPCLFDDTATTDVDADRGDFCILARFLRRIFAGRFRRSAPSVGVIIPSELHPKLGMAPKTTEPCGDAAATSVARSCFKGGHERKVMFSEVNHRRSFHYLARNVVEANARGVSYPLSGSLDIAEPPQHFLWPTLRRLPD